MGNANTTISQKPLYAIPDPAELEIAAALALEAEQESKRTTVSIDSTKINNPNSFIPAESSGTRRNLSSSGRTATYHSPTTVSTIGNPSSVPIVPQEGSRMAILGHGLRVDDGYYDRIQNQPPSPSLPPNTINSPSLLYPSSSDRRQNMHHNNNNNSNGTSNVIIPSSVQIPPSSASNSSLPSFAPSSSSSSTSSGTISSPSNAPPPPRRIQWKRGELLGTGAYGRVYLGLNEVDGTLMAVKQVPLIINNHNYHNSTTMGMGYHHQSPGSFYDHHYLPPIHQRKNQRSPTSPSSPALSPQYPHHHQQQQHIHNPTPDIITELQQEIDLMSRLSHENIVTYLGSQIDEYSNGNESVLSIFMEFVPGGSVTQLLRRFGKFNETLVKLYTRQILKGLAYLHSEGVIHRDVKGANVLVDRSGICKLSDFGSSKSYLEMDGSYANSFTDTNSSSNPNMLGSSGAHAHRSLRGTPSFMAPEVVRQTGSGRKADIWSIGCTVIEMGTGRPPWAGYDNPIQAMFVIATSTGPPPIPEEFSLEGKEFLLLCLQRAPEERPTAIELLQHPFITGINPLPRPISRGSNTQDTVKTMSSLMVINKDNNNNDRANQNSPEKTNKMSADNNNSNNNNNNNNNNYPHSSSLRNESTTNQRSEYPKETIPVSTMKGSNVSVENTMHPDYNEENDHSNTDENEEDAETNDNDEGERTDTLSTLSMMDNTAAEEIITDQATQGGTVIPNNTNNSNNKTNMVSSVPESGVDLSMASSPPSLAKPSEQVPEAVLPSRNPFSRSAAGKAKPALQVDITVPISRSSVNKESINSTGTSNTVNHSTLGRSLAVSTSPMAPTTIASPKQKPPSSAPTTVRTIVNNEQPSSASIDTANPHSVTTKPSINNRFTFTIDEQMKEEYATSPKGKKVSHGTSGAITLTSSSSSLIKGIPSTTATTMNQLRNNNPSSVASSTMPSLLKSINKSAMKNSNNNNRNNNDNVLSTDFLVDCIEDATRDIGYTATAPSNRPNNNINNGKIAISTADTENNTEKNSSFYPSSKELIKTLQQQQQRSPFNRISPIATNVSLSSLGYANRKGNSSNLLDDSDDEDSPTMNNNDDNDDEEPSADSLPVRKFSGASQTSSVSTPFSPTESNTQSPSHSQSQKPGFFQRMFSPIARKKGNGNSNSSKTDLVPSSVTVSGEASPATNFSHQSTPRNSELSPRNNSNDNDDDDDELDDILTSTQNQRIYASLSSSIRYPLPLVHDNNNGSNGTSVPTIFTSNQQYPTSQQWYANQPPYGVNTNSNVYLFPERSVTPDGPPARM